MAGVWAEDEIGRKWDRCFTDAVIKLGGGILIGSVFSLFLLKRKKWPVITGAGFGLGMAYSNCQKDLNASLNPCKKLQERKCDEKIK